VSTRPRSRATRAGCAPMRRAVAHATRVRAPRRCETCSCPPGVSCYARTGQPPPRACGRAVADAAVEAVLTLSTGAERGVRTAYSAGGMTSRQASTAPQQPTRSLPFLTRGRSDGVTGGRVSLTVVTCQLARLDPGGEPNVPAFRARSEAVPCGTARNGFDSNMTHFSKSRGRRSGLCRRGEAGSSVRHRQAGPQLGDPISG
jgi:hypothetical protein